MTPANPDAPALFLARAREDLRAARHDLTGGFVRAAISRAYFAALHAARAALLHTGEAPRTHTGVQRRFAYHFVRTGRVPVEVASVLAYADTVRSQADYNATTLFDTGAATDLIRDVETFVTTIEGLLPPTTPESNPP
ncbi:MAG: HEPN domain-containing protein [Bacteroidetes bacterium]|nr:MAG: HEPN domain-containing protein [Bacteroidota bacterium]